MKLVFASNNPNKIKEIQQLLPDSIQVLSLSDINCDADIPETADTIEGNAILKAIIGWEACQSDLLLQE